MENKSITDYVVISACVCFSYLYLWYRALKDTKNKPLIFIEGMKIFGMLIVIVIAMGVLRYG